MKTPWTLTWPFLRRRAAEKNALLDDEQYAQTPDPLASVQLPACALARESVAQACATGSASGPTIGTLRAVRERVKGPVFRPPSGAAYRSVNEQLIVARRQLRQVEMHVVGRVASIVQCPAQLGLHLVDLGQAHAAFAQ